MVIYVDSDREYEILCILIISYKKICVLSQTKTTCKHANSYIITWTLLLTLTMSMIHWDAFIFKYFGYDLVAVEIWQVTVKKKKILPGFMGSSNVKHLK